jgi:hypothetical protein
MVSRLECDFRRFDALKAKLGAMRDGLDTPAGRRFVAKVKQIVIDDNRDGLLRGLDANGVPFAPLAASTIAHRDGSGEPLTPHGAASRLIANAVATDYRSGGQVIVILKWVGDVAVWIRYHRTGTRKMPRRNPVGVRPAARQRIRDAFKQFQRDLVKDGGK